MLMTSVKHWYSKLREIQHYPYSNNKRKWSLVHHTYNEGLHFVIYMEENGAFLPVYLFIYLQYWALNSEPIPWATPPALFCEGFFFEIGSHELFA
jgi:hypothetical protein